MSLSEEQLEQLSDELRALGKDEIPKTSEELQKFVDKSTGVVSTAIDAAIDEQRHLTQMMLEAAGVTIRSPASEISAEQNRLHHEGLWHTSEDVQQYEDTKNSYIGCTFIRWMVREKNRCQTIADINGSMPNLRNKIAQYLPPVDVAVKINRIDGVNVRDNTFASVFTVLLDWEDPSVSMSSGDFVAEQHFYPKYSIDNCDSSALIEIGDGRRSHPRRDKLSWHIKWTAKYQATLKTPLNPEKYPFDFQELRICVKPNSVDTSMLSFLGKEPHNFDMKSRIFVEFQHPLRWRRHSGHSLDKNADWLPDFDVVGIHGERTGDDYETYTVAVGIKRDPTNINGSVVASMAVTSIISSFSFFISEFADALAVVLTALLTAVAYKIIMAEQLPLTPKPSIIEKYITLSLGQFGVQACVNCGIHLFSANVVEGFVAQGDFTCEAEVDYFHIIAFYNASDDSQSIGNGQRWWCNFASFLNAFCFLLNLVYIAGLHIYFFRTASDITDRQIIMEQTWYCINDEAMKMVEETHDNKGKKSFKIKKSSSRRIVQQISDSDDQKVQSRKSGKKKKKLASFDPAVTIMGTESNLAPSIYQSPLIRCVFTVGNLDDETYCYEPAKQPSSKIGARWCGPDSGVDPWRVAQRLAVKPRQVRDHYVKCGFSKLSNVNPTAPCLESLSGERGECDICDLVDGETNLTSRCTKPRTWIIGQELHFANPKSRDESIVRTIPPGAQKKPSNISASQVAPAAWAVETKKQ